MFRNAVRMKAAAIALLLSGSVASAQTVCPDQTAVVPYGFMTIGEFVQLPSGRAADIVMGFVNGYTVAALSGASAACVQQVHERCFLGRNNIQLAEILKQWAQANPRRWHEPLNVGMYQALVNLCLYPDRR